MNGLLIDTSGWGNLFDSSQPYHFQTTEIYLSAKAEDNKIITTNYIIIELVSLLISLMRMPRQKIIQFIPVDDKTTTDIFYLFIRCRFIIRWKKFLTIFFLKGTHPCKNPKLKSTTSPCHSTR